MKACPNVDYCDALLLVLQQRRPANMLPQCQRLVWNLFIFSFYFISKEKQNIEKRKTKKKHCGRDVELQSNANFRFEIPVRSRIDRLWICLCFFPLFFFFAFLSFSFLIFRCSRRVIAFCAHISIIISYGWVAWRPVFWARSMCEDKMSSTKEHGNIGECGRECRGYEAAGGVVDTLTYCTRCECINLNVDGCRDGWCVRFEPITIGKPLTNDVIQPILRHDALSNRRCDTHTHTPTDERILIGWIFECVLLPVYI